MVTTSHDPLLTEYESWEQARDEFSWDIPEQYNIATDLISSHADRKGKLALIYEDINGSVEKYSFKDVDFLSNKLANLLADYGVERGDRIAVNLPNIPETALLHMAAYKLGAVVVPLSDLFGPDALEYRLRDSGAKVFATNDEGLEKIGSFVDSLNDLSVLASVDINDRSDVNLREAYSDYKRTFEAVTTKKDDDALLVYTSGTTGDPKGVLHGHRYVPGYYPGFEMWNNLEVGDDTLFWSPGSWAWVGSLVAWLYCSWHYGRPYLSRRSEGGFDPAFAFETIADYGVTNTFIPPTALKRMMGLAGAVKQYDVSDLNVVSVAGESCGAELVRWVEDELDASIVELFGQTEANMLLSNTPKWFDVKPGSMGKPVPGSDVDIVDSDGDPVDVGEVGEVALKQPDPVMFKEYWNKPEKTADTFVDNWMLTGDLVEKDEDGYYWYKSRTDDVIITSGYRVGPAEVEDTLVEHPAIENAAVVGIEDEERGEIIKAFVKLLSGESPSDELREDIASYVKERLAKYEYPREIEFVEGFPTTVTGKIQRNKLRNQ